MLTLRTYLTLLACTLLFACSAEPRGQVRLIEIYASDSGPWRVVYRLGKPARRIDLGPTLGDLRAVHWRVETAGVEIETKGDRDYIASDNAFDVVELSVDPIAPPLPKNYQAFAPAGDGGVLVYTGHFFPRTDDGRLVQTPVTMRAPDQWRVSVFDHTASVIKNWRSAFAEPAFVYFGPVGERSDEALSVVLDPRLPDWVLSEVETIAPIFIDALSQRFDMSPPVRPQVFVSAGDFTSPGQISYRGDATPWQFQMTIEGAGWLDYSKEARDVLLLGLAHEAAHLWQTASPGAEGAPDWIHEGGAEAVAVELLLYLGAWKQQDAEDHYARAAKDCDAIVGGRNLADAEASGDWRGVYACGLLINRAAAGLDGPAEFWRRFMAAAGPERGYSATSFFDFAATIIGDADMRALAARVQSKPPKPGNDFLALGDSLTSVSPDAAAAQ